MSQLVSQNKPVITTQLVITAIVIHLLLNIIDYGFYAWSYDVFAYRDRFNEFAIGILKPLVAALLLSPFVVLARHSHFKREFCNILFIAITISITFSLLSLVEASKIHY